MTDDLLDEATRLAKAAWQYPEVANTLRALVERVQQAEEAVEVNAGEAAIFLATADATRIERDAARGKLDKVRDWAHHIRTTRQRGDIEYNAASDVLAILDEEPGD